MSTRFLHASRRFFAMSLVIAAVVLCLRVSVAAQQVSVRLHIIPETSRVVIDGSCPATARWSFPDSYGGVLGLGKRVEQFAALDDSGAEIPTRKLAPGQFDSAKAASRFRYEVNLMPSLGGADSAKVSWLTRQRGLLMLADLLPIISGKNSRETAAIVRFQAPESWAVQSNDREGPLDAVEVSDIDRAVFAVGSDLRTSRLTESGMSFRLITDGEWAFADVEVLEMAARILKAYREVFGAMPAKQGTLILFPFPRPAAVNQWSAETRGSTVTLLLGKLPSKIGALAQVSTPLTHELFHLWVPNALALEGDYDWFYEGFTVYQAARTAVHLDLLTFAEFLNSIARAHDASNVQANSVSLMEASRSRWTNGQSSVYSKSMVVAFLYDLRLRSVSHGKKSLDNVYRAILQKHSSGAAGRSDGNEGAMQALAVDGSAENFVREFIRNPVTIDLASELAPFGLRVEVLGLRTRIGVSEKLNKQQRDLLRELGYNDAVRSPRR
jgi:predicted metalloprotease with PDZ domain